MTDVQNAGSGRRWVWCAGLLLVLAAGASFAWLQPFARRPEPRAVPGQVAEATRAQVDAFCGACHSYPSPDLFPREHWRLEVKRGYDFYVQSNLDISYPSIEAVTAYYEKRAPEHLGLQKREPAATPFPVRWKKTGQRLPGTGPAPAVSSLNLVPLSDPKKLDVLACDMRSGQVLSLRPHDPFAGWQVLGKVDKPASATVVDLDADGIKDILVADLGNFAPTNERTGRVVWLRGTGDGSYRPITLLENVGRVADVQAVDLAGTGKLDLVVAVFGWKTTGEIVHLQNQTTDWSQPKFRPRILDERHGAIHVKQGDIDGDGKPEIVGLISQEHETIVAFFHQPDGSFVRRTLWSAPHPAYGCSGIELVDLDRDGKLDVLCTNGDVLDQPFLLKPYHGVQWLQNQGDAVFAHHHLAVLPGAHKAVAGDVDGDGDLDVVAVSYLPPPGAFPERASADLDSVILLEQTTPGRFVRHVLEKNQCDHVACALGDIYGDGRLHLVIGGFSLAEHYELPAGVAFWRNLGTRN